MRHLLHRLGLHDLEVVRDDWRRVLTLVVVCLLCAVMVLDFPSAPTESHKAGDVAPRTVKVPFTFKYTDHAAYQELRREAAQSVLPVFVHRTSTSAELTSRVQAAFAEARGGWRLALDELAADDVAAARDGSGPPLTEHQRKLLKELDKSLRDGGDRHSPNAKSWTDRVKDLFK